MCQVCSYPVKVFCNSQAQIIFSVLHFQLLLCNSWNSVCTLARYHLRVSAESCATCKNAAARFSTCKYVLEGLFSPTRIPWQEGAKHKGVQLLWIPNVTCQLYLCYLSLPGKSMCWYELCTGTDMSRFIRPQWRNEFPVDNIARINKMSIIA